MIKWLNNLFNRKKHTKIKYVKNRYGRYLHRPVIDRALPMVMGVSKHDLIIALEDQKIIILNDQLIHLERLGERLPSGNYEIKMPADAKIWYFFIQ